jgi:hypothetical protein
MAAQDVTCTSSAAPRELQTVHQRTATTLFPPGEYRLAPASQVSVCRAPFPLDPASRTHGASIRSLPQTSLPLAGDLLLQKHGRVAQALFHAVTSAGPCDACRSTMSPASAHPAFCLCAKGRPLPRVLAHGNEQVEGRSFRALSLLYPHRTVRNGCRRSSLEDGTVPALHQPAGLGGQLAAGHRRLFLPAQTLPVALAVSHGSAAAMLPDVRAQSVCGATER